jgi:hypothetical protein
VAQKFTTGITVRDLASAASDAVAVSVAGDTNDRIKFEAGGKVVWGSGAAAGDVNLYRDAADRLKTDDALQADGGIITVTTAGTPTLSLPDGALAIDTTNNLLYIRTNSTWEIASGGGGASVTTSDGAPADPESGDLWYETDTGSMFVYYDDGDSQQWVEVGTAGVIAMTTSDTAPSSPSNGDLWFDTSTAKTYVYYDDGSSQQWVEVGAASAAASGTDGAIQFASGGTFSSDASNLVWDDTNNRLGIGTTTPAYKLDVAGDIHISNSTPYLIFTDTDTNAESRISASSGVGSLIIDADYNNEQAGTNIIFNSDGSERMRIDDSGRVGIGTTAPSQELDVNGDIVVPVGNGIMFDRVGSDSHILYKETPSSSTYGSPDDVVLRNPNGARLRFQTNGTNDRMTIDSSGNVGIGTTSPSYKLDVDGDINMRTGHSFYYDVAGATNPNPVFWIDAENTDIDIIRVGTDQFSTDSDYGMTLKYRGSGAGNDNTFDVEMDAQAGAQVVAMRTYQDGTVTMPNQPCFYAYRSGSNPTHGAGWSIMSFNSELFDSGGNYNTSNYRFVAPVTGNYQFNTTLNVYNVDVSQNATQFVISLYKNGVEQTRLYQGAQYTTASQDRNRSGSAVMRMNANDYAEIRVYSADTNYQMSAGQYWNSFSGFLIG